MPEFLKLTSPAEARSLLLDKLRPLQDAVEEVATIHALRRIVAEDVRAPHPLPEFPRSTVDGFAVRASDTYGAGSAQPAYLALAGEVPMGAAPMMTIESGRCVLIHTGGMLPKGADAVVMLEHAEGVGSQQPPAEIEVHRALAPGDNVIQVGEDVIADQVVLQAGREIRAQEIGGLLALGLLHVRAARQPRVGIISTGDEIVEPEIKPARGQVRDVNAYTLSALLVEQDCQPIRFGIVPDEPGRLMEAAAEALGKCDLLVITAGSSASTRDLTAETIRALGSPGVLVHGVNIRPGKPTILGVCGGKPVIGLPGNPVSAFVVARLFVLPAAARLQGRRIQQHRPIVVARLSANLPSQAGREDWWPVKLEASAVGGAEWLAAPVFGRSNLIFNLVAADGMLRIPPDVTGLAAGDVVDVEPI